MEAHNFQITYLTRFTWCDVCEQFIWGVFNPQGYECAQCKLVCHIKCAANVTAQCTGTAARIRGQLTRRKSSSAFDKTHKDMRTQLGDSIPAEEELVAWYSAWYKGRGVPHIGKLYVTKNYVAFCSPKKVIPVEDILVVEKKEQKGVTLRTPDKEFNFILLVARDEFADMLNYLCLTVDNERVRDAIANNNLPLLRKVLSKAKYRKRLAGSVGSLEQQVRDEYLPLTNAVLLGRLVMIPLLLNEDSVDINATDRHGYTALHCALAEGTVDEETILLLLESDEIRMDIQNSDGNTALHYFCSCYPYPDCHKIAKLMIEDKKADINAQNGQGETPLHKATKNSYIRLLMVQLLLEYKVDLNVQTKMGETALTYAVRLGREDLMHVLLNAGADPLVRGKNDEPLIQMAERENPQLAPTLAAVVRLSALIKEEGLDARIRLNLVREELTEPDVLSRVDEVMCDRLGVNNPAHRARLLRLARVSIAPTSPAARANKIQAELTAMAHVPQGDLMFIKAKDIEFTEKIGTGASGKVWKALFRGNMTVAVKVLKNPEGGDISEFKREVQIMASINTPHTVQFYGCVLEPKVCLVMELCSRKSLYHVLNREREFGWEQFFSFAEQCVTGVHSLHAHDPPILHRDLKSLNLLVTQDWKIKICDFGLARFNTTTNQNTLGKTRGTVAYMCPEIFEGQKFTVKSDVFSVALILWEMANRVVQGTYERPYADLEYDFHIINKVTKEQLRPPFAANTPTSIVQLISQCWAHDWNVRPNCEQLLNNIKAVREEYVNNLPIWKAVCNPNVVVHNEDSYM